jgi:predicted AAA+ superfamily ATPase
MHHMSESHSLYPRLLAPRVAQAMADTPVVLIAGPRQAGKTTLARHVAAQGMRYLTLDDELTLLAAREDCRAIRRRVRADVLAQARRGLGKKPSEQGCEGTQDSVH